ncbi:MAG: glycosyltransferase [Candidatus Kapaibacterium sp.]
MIDREALVIAYYFPPMGLSGVQRTVKFVKYLPENRLRPVVLTTTPAAYYAFDDTMLEEVESEGINIYRTPADVSRFAGSRKSKTIKYPSPALQKIRKAILQTIFQPDSRRLWKKPALELADYIFKRHDIKVIYATAPPFTDFLVAYELSKLYGIPFVVDYRDLWVDNAFYFYATPFHKLYSIRLESEILTHARKAIVTTRHMKEMLLRRYPVMSHSDVSIIPHGYDESDFAATDGIKPDPKKFTITHSGLFPDDLTPKYFLRALAEFFRRNPEARGVTEARFVGLMRRAHLKMIRRYKLTENVVTTGYVSHPEVIRHLKQSDLLWMMITNNIATPSRMYEYLGARKPFICCAPEGSIRRDAEASDAVLTTDPADVSGIRQALEAFYNMWKNNSLPRPSDEYVARFDRRQLTSELARELMHAAAM